jgi:hypothetical protein
MKKEIIEKIAALIIAAFGLVAALAWNEAIKELFAQVFSTKSALISMFIYAIVITIIAVIITIWIGKLSEKTNN